MLRQTRTALRTVPLLALGAGVLLAGCAAPSGAEPAPSASSSAPAVTGPITGVRWQLTTNHDAWFQLTGHKLTGKDSCNTLGGSVMPVGTERVDFGRGPISTMMACPDPSGAQDAMRAALRGPRTWDRLGDRLTLTDPTSNQHWSFTAAPAAPSSSPAPTSAPSSSTSGPTMTPLATAPR